MTHQSWLSWNVLSWTVGLIQFIAALYFQFFSIPLLPFREPQTPLLTRSNFLLSVLPPSEFSFNLFRIARITRSFRVTDIGYYIMSRCILLECAGITVLTVWQRPYAARLWVPPSLVLFLDTKEAGTWVSYFCLYYQYQVFSKFVEKFSTWSMSTSTTYEM